MDNYFTANSSMYQSRIENKYLENNSILESVKELEKLESQMVNKLQTTFMKEKQMH
jgi:hypothetical protein